VSADALLSRLDRVKRTGQGRWVANCPSHASKSKQSLSIRELDDGRVLLHCWASCDINEILGALSLTIEELFPDKPLDGHGNKRERRPFSYSDALHCVARESLYVAIVAGDLARGESLAETERERLLLAAARINTAIEACECR
jgi:hypothetical protein